MNSPAISVQHVSKQFEIYDAPTDRLRQLVLAPLRQMAGLAPRPCFRSFDALKDVSFDIARGEAVGIVGRNGSGKSTLLQIVCGVMQPSAGAVRVQGRVSALLELGSGFNPEFTGRENVFMNGALLGLSHGEVEARMDRIAAFADIGAFLEQPVKTYSSGMFVRLAFAVAISVDPDILVVDEALSVGDELFQRKCFGRIEQMRARGATILFVSHSSTTVLEVCDRAILMDGGEKLASGSPRQIVGRYQKLLYAPPERQAAVRAAIAAMAQDGDAPAAAPAAAPAPAATTAPTHAPAALTLPANVSPAARERDAPQESFDPALRPASTVAYESRGAHIDDPHIQTLSGQRVNRLVSGRTYRYAYTVRFTEAARGVRFGMLVKTTTGVELGGATSHKAFDGGLADVAAGAAVRVEYQFKCLLNAGIYFLNAGVSAQIDGEIRHLHRLLDACCFGVMDDAPPHATGIVNFACVPEIVTLAPTPSDEEAAAC